jgi:hypothetical protein
MMALILGMYVSHELLHMINMTILAKGSSSGYFVVCVEQKYSGGVVTAPGRSCCVTSLLFLEGLN